MLSNSEIEEFALDALSRERRAKFSVLLHLIDTEHGSYSELYRQLDRALQRLRKAGRIRYAYGYWRRVTDSDLPP